MRFLPALLITGLLLFCSCASMKIGSRYDRLARFDTLKTYAWAPGSQTGLNDQRLNAKFIDPQIRGNVDAELAAKGYTRTSVDKADFLVSYYVSIEDGVGSETIEGGSYYAGFSVTMADGEVYGELYRDPMSVSYVDIYRVGSVQLGIQDPKTKKLIWHGTAQAKLLENVSLDRRKQRLKEAVHRIMSLFPPK